MRDEVKRIMEKMYVDNESIFSYGSVVDMLLENGITLTPEEDKTVYDTWDDIMYDYSIKHEND